MQALYIIPLLPQLMNVLKLTRNQQLLIENETSLTAIMHDKMRPQIGN